MVDISLLLDQVFSASSTSVRIENASYLTDYSNHQEAGKFLVCDYKNLSEVPLCILPRLVLKDFLNKNNGSGVVAYPLYYSYITTARTAARIFRNITSNNRLGKVITNKGRVFYIGKGIILDEDMFPLMLFTCNITEIIRTTEGTWTAFVDSIAVRVSPEVLTSDDLLCKMLRKSVIPTLVTRTYQIFYHNIICKGLMSPKITIENLDRFIIRPKKLENLDRKHESAEDFLQREDIVEEIVKNI